MPKGELLVKLVEPPLAEPHERWCERSEISQLEKFPPTRLSLRELGFGAFWGENRKKSTFGQHSFSMLTQIMLTFLKWPDGIINTYDSG